MSPNYQDTSSFSYIRQLLQSVPKLLSQTVEQYEMELHIILKLQFIDLKKKKENVSAL